MVDADVVNRPASGGSQKYGVKEAVRRHFGLSLQFLSSHQVWESLGEFQSEAYL